MGAGRIVNGILGMAGLQLTRLKKVQKGTTLPVRTTDPFQQSLARVAAAPLDIAQHLAHARVCLQHGRPHLAGSVIRSAMHLGASGSEVEALHQSALDACPPLVEMSHNGYYRLSTLANAIKEFGGNEPCSILDVGGGSGELSRFLPEHSYCLAEPVSNGISGEELPFPPGSFDLVVACHVLEHIPAQHRTGFLDSMLAQSRKGVILLNPFSIDGYNEVEELELIHEHTRADWALEHLQCVVPKVQEVIDHARARDLAHVVRPNGNKLATMGVFLADFFSSVHKDERIKHFNRFMNTRMCRHADNPDMPTAYLIYLEKPRDRT